MPDTLVSLLIIIFAIIPGLPALAIYQRLFGSNWREKEWEKIAAIVAFSVIGLMVYVLISSIFKLPQPIYVIPATFDRGVFGTESLVTIALSFIGHIAGSIIVALICVGSLKLVTKLALVSVYPSAWEDFVRDNVCKHWVVVNLTNGESYAGYIDHVDVSVGQNERDLILNEPAMYDKKTKNYITNRYQSIFLPAELVSTIATCYNPETDKRIVPIHTPLLTRKKANEKKIKDTPKKGPADKDKRS
ncbi:MAG: DUF6338 family protein [Anaerolineaceae bacterium]